jgi:hypothetical protein
VITFEVDGHKYRGAPRKWGESMDLLARTMAPLASDPDGTVEKFRAVMDGEGAALIGVLRGVIALAPALALEWLEGWTRDGEPVTDETCAGLGWEPVVAAAYVAREHRFFSPSPGLLSAAADLMPDVSQMVAAMDRTPDAQVEASNEAAAKAALEAARAAKAS